MLLYCQHAPKKIRSDAMTGLADGGSWVQVRSFSRCIQVYLKNGIQTLTMFNHPAAPQHPCYSVENTGSSRNSIIDRHLSRQGQRSGWRSPCKITPPTHTHAQRFGIQSLLQSCSRKTADVNKHTLFLQTCAPLGCSHTNRYPCGSC